VEADYNQVRLLDDDMQPMGSSALVDWTAVNTEVFERLGGVDAMVEFLMGDRDALRAWYLKQVPERRTVTGEDGGPVLIQVRQL
jgi:hypothetical protein